MNRAPVIAVVPARGGSKGIPRKNLTLLAGRPLIDFTLNAARLAGIFDEIIVSTDDAEIAEFSRSRGCSVRERPEDLASDSSRVIDCVLDIAFTRHLDESTTMMVLQPTSPFRGAHHIIEAVNLLQVTGSDAVVSVVECEHHPFKTVRVENQRIVPSKDHHSLETSRQELPRLFRPNGAIYLAPLNVTRSQSSLIPARAYALEMSREDSLDIDDEDDLLLAQLRMRRQK
jgi:CMP-N-acetylneuraminic acid synthetase